VSGGVWRDIVDRVDEAIARAADTPVIVGLVAVDRMAELAELIGHERAESALQEFAQRLPAFARRQDTLLPAGAGRAAVVLRGLSSPEHLGLAAAKLERIFAPPVGAPDRMVRLDVRAGFAMASTGSAEDALRHAESALRRATKRRASWHLWREAEGDGGDGDGDLAVEHRIEGALDNGEFALHYQPKLDARARTIAGAEGLLRWHDPAHGVVSPGAFIPAAERTGSIRRLTFFAVKSALVECARWPSGLGVAVNLAPSLLDDDEILNVVRDSLALFAVAPERLTLEITESCLARDRDRAFLMLSELRRIGVRVAIDDFGTGYSSFAHFRDIPADELKIDRTFVAQMRTSDADARIVKSIVDLGHTFGMTTVAEGVEDTDAANRLERLGCDILQGYWIAKPMPPAEYRVWVERRLGPHRAAG
jgi:EAL domain-containing protein (putative c-di-GMP-specific phosphodiesterase class I)/GGDEF domain-containing protein